MKFIFGIVVIAVFAVAAADISNSGAPANEYLPPDHQQSRGSHHAASEARHHQPGHQEESMQYETSDQEETVEATTMDSEDLAPTEGNNEPKPAHILKADGYHYKIPTGRRFFY